MKSAIIKTYLILEPPKNYAVNHKQCQKIINVIVSDAKEITRQV